MNHVSTSSGRTLFHRFGGTPQPAVTRSAFVLVVLIVWEILARTVLNANFITPPTGIVAALPRVWGDTAVQHALLQTLYALTAAFVLAVGLGVIVGVGLGLNRVVVRRSIPMILLLYSIPQVTILPIFTLLFGIGAGSKIAFGVSHGIFPIVLNILAGMRSVENAHLDFARSLGATRQQVVQRIILPHITPSVFSGLRLCMSATLLGVVLAELYISTTGIGYFTRLYSDSFDPAGLFALVAALGVMAVVMNELMRVVERRATAWSAPR